MQCTLAEIAKLLGGELVGDGQLVIHDANIIRDAISGHITFADGESQWGRLSECGASAAVVGRDCPALTIPTVKVDHVASAFADVVSHLRPPREVRQAGVSPQAFVADSVTIGEDVRVYPGAFVDEDVVLADRVIVHSGARIMAGTRVGADTQIFPNVVVYENCEIGERVILHASASIGAHGFGYQTVEGQHRLSAQLGNVIIEDEVHVGANSTVDRGTFGATRIGRGTKIDNLVMIAHNCRLGEHNLICSGVGIAGSCTTGNYVVMAGQVGIRDHTEIGDGAVIGAQSGVMNDIPAGAKLLGSPAMPEREQMLIFASMMKLPKLRKEFRKLQKQLEALGAESETLSSDPTSNNASPTRQSDAA